MDDPGRKVGLRVLWEWAVHVKAKATLRPRAVLDERQGFPVLVAIGVQDQVRVRSGIFLAFVRMYAAASLLRKPLAFKRASIKKQSCVSTSDDKAESDNRGFQCLLGFLLLIRLLLSRCE